MEIRRFRPTRPRPRPRPRPRLPRPRRLRLRRPVPRRAAAGVEVAAAVMPRWRGRSRRSAFWARRSRPCSFWGCLERLVSKVRGPHHVSGRIIPMRQGWIVAVLLWGAGAAWSQEAATLSFAANHAGSYPRSVTGDDTIKVDLSALPPGAPIYRSPWREGGQVHFDGVVSGDRAPIASKWTCPPSLQGLRSIGPSFGPAAWTA